MTALIRTKTGTDQREKRNVERKRLKKWQKEKKSGKRKKEKCKLAKKRREKKSDKDKKGKGER